MNNQDSIQDIYSTKLIAKLIKLNSISTKKIDLEEIKKAIIYVKKYHAEQKRLSGEPYYIQPIEVASIVSDYLFDTNTIIAALLHDVVEDTKSSIPQLKLVFCDEVAEIVDCVTKINVKYKLSAEEMHNKINNLNDTGIKAATIKIADRLHNMRTIMYIKSTEKQKRIAEETLQVYVPIARVIHLEAIAQELHKIATATILSL